ncbi:MAG: branched-chain amino acid ABC transporter permease [Alphaproteobacteria bacterium]
MAACLIILVLLPASGSVYLTSLTAKIMIFAIAAASLDLIMGYGGMVSFGHAAFLGVGGYAVGVLSHYGVNDGYLQFAVAIGGSALVGLLIGALSLRTGGLCLLIGALSLRTGGLYFIMITFAFSQMIYYLIISLEPYGGDDGMNTDRSNFGFFTLNQNLMGPADGSRDMQLIYYMTLGVLIISVWILRHFVNSRFGMVLRGTQSNEPRMQSIGFSTFRYRLVGFVISGAICGVGGALWANHQEFVTPEYMHWFRSGEIMVMVIAGGMGTIYGPVIGAFAILIIEELIKQISINVVIDLGLFELPIHYNGQENWEFLFGPLLVMLVLFGKGGLVNMPPARAGKA